MFVAVVARSAFLVTVVLGLLLPTVAADHPGTNDGSARLRQAAALGVLDQPYLVYRYPDLMLAIERWEATYPGFVDHGTIGTTTQGFVLHSARITDERVAYDAADLSTGHKLRVYLDGSHHGNEFLGTDLLMYYLEEMLAKAAAGDADTLAFLARAEVWTVPLVNPEGNSLDTRKNGRLVDLNRNYPFQWGGPGSSGSIADFTYRGPSPLSEPESTANAAFGESLMPDLWITTHTGVAEFYWPWGWTHDKSPDDAFFVGLEKPFEEATKGAIDAMQGAELYLAAGATDDFGYGTFGIPTFTYEVHEDQFLPAYGEAIPDVIRNQLNGLDFMVKNVQFMGAWVEPTSIEGGLALENVGWGNATNVTVRLGDQEFVVPLILPGGQATVTFGGAAPDATATVSYPVMLIGTSQTRTHRVQVLAAELPAEPGEDLPWVDAAVLFAVLGLVAAQRRR